MIMLVNAPREAAKTKSHERGYKPFPNVERRNLTQELVEIPLLVRAMDLPKGKRMLEVGCGRGIALPPFADLCRPACLIGLDIDEELVIAAKQRVRESNVKAEVIHGDARYMSFADGSFDIVIDFGTCYHISYPEKALQEIARVLARGGMFVYETPVSQLLSHPIRSFGRRLPWHIAPELVRNRNAVLWASRMKRF